VQDLGRPGYAHLGVARSGALDAPALVRANRLVGNSDGAAGIETTLTGVTFRTEVRTTVAVTGAACAVRVDSQPVPFAAAVAVPAGSVVEVGSAETGVRGPGGGPHRVAGQADPLGPPGRAAGLDDQGRRIVGGVPGTQQREDLARVPADRVQAAHRSIVV